MTRVGHFQIPLDLPHAGRVVWRIQKLLGDTEDRPRSDLLQAREIVSELAELLEPYQSSGENPAEEEAGRVVAAAAELGRELVDEIEKRRLGFDRLGQCVRNLFECLELGEEGASISLRAGENPASAQRP